LLSWPPAWVDGPVPARLPAAAHRGPLVEAESDRLLLRVPPVGRFLVLPDGPVRVQREYPVSDADVACFVGGSVGAAALLLRGMLTMRAAAVSVAGAGVLICGPSAAGKSVLAGALAGRGHPVLADRIGLVTGIAPAPSGGAPPGAAAGPAVVPVDPQVQLWPDAVELLGLPPGAGRVVRPVLARRAFRLGPPPGPAPLRLVLGLSLATRRSLELTELGGGSAAGRLAALVGREWHERLVGPLGRAADRFRWLAALAGVRLVLVAGHRGGIPPAELAARVEDVLG
jgi:hypothetical protein